MKNGDYLENEQKYNAPERGSVFQNVKNLEDLLKLSVSEKKDTKNID